MEHRLLVIGGGFWPIQRLLSILSTLEHFIHISPIEQKNTITKAR